MTREPIGLTSLFLYSTLLCLCLCLGLGHDRSQIRVLRLHAVCQRQLEPESPGYTVPDILPLAFLAAPGALRSAAAGASSAVDPIHRLVRTPAGLQQAHSPDDSQDRVAAAANVALV